MSSAAWEPLRLLKYGMPFIAICLFVVLKRYLIFDRTSISNAAWLHYLGGLLLFYVIAFSFNALIAFRSPRFYQEVFFALSPLAFVVLVLAIKPAANVVMVTHVLFAGVVLAFIIETNTQLLDALLHPSQIITGLASSEVESESNLAFQFGMILIVYTHYRKWLYSIIAAGLLLLAFKRIAIIGVIVVGLLYVTKRITKGKLNPAENRWLVIGGNITAITSLFLFLLGKFDDLVMDVFGVSPNFLTVGRYDVYSDIFRHFGGVKFWGFGLGAITTFLSGANYQLINLHSDVLKIFFELGPLFFIIWIFLFHNWKKNMLTACLAIYMNILFLTDNVFIYFDVLVCYYLLSAYSSGPVKAVV